MLIIVVKVDLFKRFYIVICVVIQKKSSQFYISRFFKSKQLAKLVNK